jgi:DNA-directed RNA polymerase specialized sigma24 family protein
MSANDAARGLTAPAFARLLARLGPDAERAGAAYEHLRRALVSYFTWRGARTPEECADATLDRLARRLDEGVVVDDPARFARGIARMVLLEHWKRAEARELPLESAGPGPRTGAEEPTEEARAQCLDRCLAELNTEGRDLILEYYLAEGRDRIDTRKRMARALGLSENALRSRAQRLRDRLEQCLEVCLGSPVARRGDTNS